MMDDFYKGYREPQLKRWPFYLLVFCGISALLTVVGGIMGIFTSTVNQTAAVITKEFGPQELLRKYEWFKDASAALDKKVADISVYGNRLKSLENAYTGVPRGKWPRDEREQMGLWMTEVAGIKASYNTLAAEYNSQMAKFNWRFTNAGGLPQGASEPLPREYKSYEMN